MKICPRCKTRPRKLPGSYCKECWAKYQKERYRQNPKYLYDERKKYRKNNRPLLRKIKTKWRSKHKKEILQKAKEYGKIYRLTHKKQIRARGIMHRALKKGTIQKCPCEICGNPKSEAHHEDYNKPLEVRWFCRIHHWQLCHS